MDRVKKLTETLRMLIEDGFSGHIKINFSQGSIGRVEKFEEFDDAEIIYAGYKNIKMEEKDIYDGKV
jgi:hypothetical protein